MGEAHGTEIRYFTGGKPVGKNGCAYCKHEICQGERRQTIDDPGDPERKLNLHDRHDGDCWDLWCQDQRNKQNAAALQLAVR